MAEVTVTLALITPEGHLLGRQGAVVEFAVECMSCRASLTSRYDAEGAVLIVEPCAECQDAVKEAERARHERYSPH